MVDYSRKYLNLTQDKTLTIWWKLFNVPSSKNWTNILNFIELLFCLPMSNGHVERVFSTLKLMKSDRRNSLSEHHLDDIMRIMIEGPPLSQWDPSRAIQLWWQEKLRRSVGDTRKAPKKNKTEMKVMMDCHHLHQKPFWIWKDGRIFWLMMTQMKCRPAKTNYVLDFIIDSYL